MKNIIILDMARNILKSKNLLKEFWAEAMACAIYLSNQSLRRNIWEKILQETWSGRKLEISHIRIFGYKIYARVQNKIRNKLDDKSEVFIFIGYGSNPKATSYTVQILRKSL